MIPFINSDIPMCVGRQAAEWFFFSPDVPSLVYYSHVPVIILSLLIGIFVYSSNTKRLAGKVLFHTILAFVLWVTLDLIFWASDRSDIIMLVWSVILLIEPLVYIGCLYLIHVLVDKKDLGLKSKSILALIFLPLIIFVPTAYGLSGFDVGTCLANEGPIALYYTYFVEIVCTLWIIIYAIVRYLQAVTSEKKKEIIYLTLGIIVLLVAFAWGNIIGSFTENWQLGQFGLFGMPVFTGLIAYTIIRFKEFNVKLLGAEALVVALCVMILSLLFINSLSLIHVLVGITFVFLIIFGVLLVKSVRREVESRVRIEQLAGDLQKANDRLVELDKQKTEFISFATHQLRAPLTAMKGYASLLLEGDLGELAPAARDAVTRISDSSKTLANVVDDYLNVSRIELGTMKYFFVPIDLRELVKSVIAEVKPNIDKTGLVFSFTAPDLTPPASYKINADKDKLKQVINNLIDNSLKYTPKGSMKVSVFRTGDLIRFSVEDTGVGINPEVLPRLFQKFTRANNANAVNIHGTGLGLFVARDVVLAHHGKIWAESEGEGKGSKFVVELAAA